MVFRPNGKTNDLQLVAEKRIEEVYRISCAAQASIHEQGREDRRKDPEAVDDEEGFKPVIREPSTEGAGNRTKRRLPFAYETLYHPSRGIRAWLNTYRIIPYWHPYLGTRPGLRFVKHNPPRN